MEKKYIIDVGDAYTKHICGKGDMLCLPVRINEFEDNWLNTNIPLTPYTEPDMEKVREEAYRQGYDTGYGTKVNEFYEQGLVDAWAAARKIANMPYDEEEKAFGSGGWAFIEKHTASEAIEKIRQHEQEQEEIQVGDEVKWNGDEFDAMFVVTHIGEDGYISGINSEEMRYERRNPKNWTKTGRRFPELAEVLAKMKEES